MILWCLYSLEIGQQFAPHESIFSINKGEKGLELFQTIAYIYAEFYPNQISR